MKRNNLKNLLYIYSIVARSYKDEKGKLVCYTHWTDGYIQIPIAKTQRDEIIRQADQSERYEIGVEVYENPTGKREIDGYPETTDMELRTVQFQHIFMRGEYIGEVWETRADISTITFIPKSENIKEIQKQKEESCKAQNSEQITTQN